MIDKVDNNLHNIVKTNIHSIDNMSTNGIISDIVIGNNQLDISKQESVDMVCRQTDYSVDEARRQLERFNYDYMKVLNNYFSVDESKTVQKTLSVNQQIYGEIRNLMDIGAKRFRTEQENAKKYEK